MPPLIGQPPRRGYCRAFILALSVTALVLPCLSTLPARAESGAVLKVRSRNLELHYQLAGASPYAQVELWYTRDRGTTWEKYATPAPAGGRGPLLFLAPAEGLYGFIIIAHDGDKASCQPPVTHDQPQRWVYVDYTPPLVQWISVTAVLPSSQPAGAGGDRSGPAKPILQLHWTAYDGNFPARPVSLYYQSSIEQTWQVIESAIPNVGRYDWRLPGEFGGQITLKLALHDLGGHVVERLWGPMPTETLFGKSAQDQYLAESARGKNATSRPAAQSRPALVEKYLHPQQQKKARDLYERGVFHLRRGEHALAAERLLEALEVDPNMLPAMIDLAGVYYTQLDFPKAIAWYKKVLAMDARNRNALLGTALAYSTSRQYAQSRDMLKRMLDLDDADAEAWLDLGDVLFQMGSLTEARAHWSKAAGLDKASPEIIEEARGKLKSFVPLWSNSTAASAAPPDFLERNQEPK